MTNANYKRGYDFERAVCKRLLDEGAEYAIRTPGSRGPADVIAFYPPESPLTFGLTRVKLVQCKTNARRLDAASRIRLFTLADSLRAIAIVASRGPNGRGIVFETLEPA